MRGSIVAALAAVVLCVVCVVAATSHAIVPRTGHGFSIADDDANWNNTEDLPQLGDGFRRLNPKMFRLQIIWNAFEGGPLRTRWIERTHDMIDRAREQGVQTIVLTIRSSYPEELGAFGYTPTVTEYDLMVRQIVQEFADDVDVWGAANEPNYWVPGGGSVPAARLAEWQSRMDWILDNWDSTALLTSPDFLDSSPNWSTYIDSYKLAGGTFGNAAAFHPYKAVADMSLATVNSYAEKIPAGVPIWVSEAGAHWNLGSVGQHARVNWMVNTLGSHARVNRISYYHMRGGNPAWDTGLLNNDLTARAAWSSWCAAAHGGDPSHTDCTGYHQAPSGTGRVGIVAGDGAVWIKEGLPAGPWHLLGGSNFAARDVELDAQRLVTATGDGAVWMKGSLPSGGWGILFGPEYGTRDVEISGDRVAVIQGNGAVWLKDGLPGGPLYVMGAANFAARDIELDGNRLVVATGDGAVWLKDGLPGATWQMMFGPEYDTRDVEISGSRIAVVQGNGAVWTKEGIPGGALHQIGGAEFAARDIELEGGRLVVASGDGAVWFKDVLPGGAWQIMFGPEYDTKDVEISGNRIGVIQGNGAIWTKEGLPGGALHMVGGPAYSTRDLTMP